MLQYWEINKLGAEQLKTNQGTYFLEKTHFGKLHFDKIFTSITTTTTRLVLNSYDTALTKLLPNSYQTPTKLQLNSVKPLTHIVTALCDQMSERSQVSTDAQ